MLETNEIIDVDITTSEEIEVDLTNAGGPRGYSAYEIAVKDGYTGTETQWLASLVGPKGDTGATGATGSQGIQGPTGPQGVQGKPFTIAKTYSSIEAMNQDLANMNENDFVMIASSVSEEDNAKLFVKSNNKWDYITDFSGSQGIQGEQGPQGPQGNAYVITTTDYQAIADIVLQNFVDGSEVEY